MEIRPAVLSDIEPILTLKRPYASHIPPWLGFIPRIVYEQQLPNDFVFVSMEQETLAGYIWYTYVKKRQFYRLNELAVAESYWGQGIGAALFRLLPKPAHWIVLEDNPANAFYDKMGAWRVGRKLGKRYPLILWTIF